IVDAGPIPPMIPRVFILLFRLDEVVKLNRYSILRRYPVGYVYHLRPTTTSWRKHQGYRPVWRVSCRYIKVGPAYEIRNCRKEIRNRCGKVAFFVSAIIINKYSNAKLVKGKYF